MIFEPLNVFVCSCLYCPCHTNTFSKHRLPDHIPFTGSSTSSSSSSRRNSNILHCNIYWEHKTSKKSILAGANVFVLLPFFRLWTCLCARYYRLFVCAFPSKANKKTKMKKQDERKKNNNPNIMCWIRSIYFRHGRTTNNIHGKFS